MRSAVIVSSLIMGAAAVAATGLYLYFSPYHSCVRALAAGEYTPSDAALACLHGIEPASDAERTIRPYTRARLLGSSL